MIYGYHTNLIFNKKEVTVKIKECKIDNIYKLPGFYDNLEDFFSIFAEENDCQQSLQ